MAVLAGGFVAVGGCSASGGADGLSEEAGAALSAHMADVRAAVADDEPDAAQKALDALHAEARSRAEAGEISSQRLAAIGTAVDNVEQRLDEADTEPTSEPEPEPEPEREPEPEPEREPEPEPEPEPEDPDPDPDPDPGEGNNGNGNGEGNGNGTGNNGKGNDKNSESDGDGEEEEEAEEQPAEEGEGG